MNDQQIEYLQALLKNNKRVAWMPDDSVFLEIKYIGKHVEEGYAPCAIGYRGKYIALYNAHLSDFIIFERISL